MYRIFTFREFKSIHKGKTAILHLCFGTEKNRRLVAKKPDIIGLFAGDIFLSPHYGRSVIIGSGKIQSYQWFLAHQVRGFYPNFFSMRLESYDKRFFQMM